MNGVSDPTAEETELAARLRLVVGRLNRRIRIDGRESVPPLQLSAMVTVEEHGPLRLSELARREAVSVPTMSRVLAALDDQGLVVRTPDPQDARGVLVTLSDDGERRLAEVRSHRTALVARRLGRLDAEQRASAGWRRCLRWRRCWSTRTREGGRSRRDRQVVTAIPAAATARAPSPSAAGMLGGVSRAWPNRS